MAMLEAMAARCVVIVSEMASTGAVIVDGVNGFLIEPGNVAQLAERLGDILERSDRLEELRAEARRTVAEIALRAIPEVPLRTVAKIARRAIAAGARCTRLERTIGGVATGRAARGVGTARTVGIVAGRRVAEAAPRRTIVARAARLERAAALVAI